MSAANLERGLLLAASPAWTPQKDGDTSYLTYGFYGNRTDLPQWYQGKSFLIKAQDGTTITYDMGNIVESFNFLEKGYANSVLKNYISDIIKLQFRPVSDAAGSAITFARAKTHNHHMMAAARWILPRKLAASLSYRVARRRQSLRRQNMRSMALRPL